jgi:hypothetical protein
MPHPSRRSRAKMREREARADECMVGAVKRQQWRRRSGTAGCLFDAISESRPHPGRTGHRAKHAQQADFLPRVEQSQRAVELKPIDEFDRLGEADMLGSQIAVSVDNLALLDAHPHGVPLRAPHLIAAIEERGQMRQSGPVVALFAVDAC